MDVAEQLRAALFLIDEYQTELIECHNYMDKLRAENEKLRKSLQKIMRMAKNNSTHAWDSHAEYWRMAKAGLGEDQ
jgi:uncharacterized protein YigA (DUF484 family)